MADTSCNFDQSRRHLATSVPAARWGGVEQQLPDPRLTTTSIDRSRLPWRLDRFGSYSLRANAGMAPAVWDDECSWRALASALDVPVWTECTLVIGDARCSSNPSTNRTEFCTAISHGTLAFTCIYFATADPGCDLLTTASFILRCVRTEKEFVEAQAFRRLASSKAPNDDVI